MIVFIDDSGDPGFQLEKGSSEIFVLALVIFDDELEAEKTAVTLKQLRRDLKFPDIVEFKFNKSSSKVREKFLEAIVPFKFRIRAIIVRKNSIKSDYLSAYTENFFNYFIMSVFKNSGGTIKNAKLKFDKRGDKRIRNELRTYLSKSLDNGTKNIFRKLDFADSKQNILIQMADMIAGMINNSIKTKNNKLLDIISNQIEDLWEFK